MWAIRAYVMARKGVLVNSPGVSTMSQSQWAFEYLALKRKEKETFESTFKALRLTLVSILGLNAIRPEDDKGKPKNFDMMSDEEKEAFLPLVAWVGRPELMKIVKDQMEVALSVEKATDDDAYEALVAQIDNNDGDMDPILGLPQSEYKPVPAGMKIDPMYQESLKELVKQYPGPLEESESVIDVDGDV